MTCSSCLHFLRGGANPSWVKPAPTFTDDDGLCRLNPPVMVPPDQDSASHAWAFPVVHREHVCGQHESEMPL